VTGDLYAPVEIDATTTIGAYCVLGCPKEERLRSRAQNLSKTSRGEPVSVGPGCIIANHVTVYEGVNIERGCFLEDRVRIGYGCSVGARTRVIYGAYVCDRVQIGEEAIVAGFVCDGTVIGDRSTVMGELVHEYTRPHGGWWDVDEAPPVVAEDSVVGRGARIIGGVHIGPRSYVASGAIVTRDVPPEHIVTGTNQCTPAAQWKGERLQSLIQHWQAISGDVGTD
jgi:acetyltransferase-like isoleucine patch superfamily enzyme